MSEQTTNPRPPASTSEEGSRLARLSPDDLMVGFTKSPIVASLVVVAILHLVLAGASYGLGLVLADDEGEQVATDVESEQVEDASETDDQSAPASDDNTTEPRTNGEQASQPPAVDEQGNPLPESVRNSEMYQQTTSLPGEDEIPEEPDLGIGIEDTNIRR